MRRGEATVGAALLLLACAIVWAAAGMPPGRLGVPGPGFFPRALGALLAAVSVGLLVRAWRLSATTDEAVGLGHRNITLTVAALAALGLVFEYLGYVLSATLLMLVLLRAFSALGWLRSLAAAVATVLVSYVIFVHALGVSLPAGLMQFP
jgi:putative tricarboxylic transport membrane protein